MYNTAGRSESRGTERTADFGETGEGYHRRQRVSDTVSLIGLLGP